MLYGVEMGGDYGGGSIFKIDTYVDPEFNFATVHTFGNFSGDGVFPSGPLIQASDGELYGTTRNVALSEGEDFYLGEGTVFRLDLYGSSYEVIRDFHSGYGRYPIGGLIEGFDGSFYGVTESGGPFGNASVVFRLSTARIAVNEIWPSSASSDGVTQVAILGGGFDAGVSVSVGGVPAANPKVFESTFLEASMPPLSPGRLYDVSVTVSDSEPGTATATKVGTLSSPTSSTFRSSVSFTTTSRRSSATASPRVAAAGLLPQRPGHSGPDGRLSAQGEHGSTYVPPACAGVFPTSPARVLRRLDRAARGRSITAAAAAATTARPAR